jgi:NADPH:quinone reductase-like Zn-dependent oxidoreductase
LFGGVDKVLELVGTTTLKDSLRRAKQRGIVCMTGIVGNQWSFDDFAPMEAIPTAVCLTSYNGKSEDFMRTPLEELVDQIAAGTLHSRSAMSFNSTRSSKRIAAWRRTKRVERSWY